MFRKLLSLARGLVQFTRLQKGVIAKAFCLEVPAGFYKELFYSNTPPFFDDSFLRGAMGDIFAGAICSAQRSKSSPRRCGLLQMAIGAHGVCVCVFNSAPTSLNCHAVKQF